MVSQFLCYVIAVMIALALYALVLFQQPVGSLPRANAPSISKQGTTLNTQNADQSTHKSQTIPATDPGNPGSKNVAPANSEQPVRIVSVPKITVDRDAWAFYVSLALAVVGVVGVVIAICTYWS